MLAVTPGSAGTSRMQNFCVLPGWRSGYVSRLVVILQYTSSFATRSADHCSFPRPSSRSSIRLDVYWVKSADSASSKAFLRDRQLEHFPQCSGFPS